MMGRGMGDWLRSGAAGGEVGMGFRAEGSTCGLLILRMGTAKSNSQKRMEQPCK